MEEERVQFSRMIKDARRRLREFLVNTDKANPFIFEKVTRGSLKKNGVQMRQETNHVCYKRLSCNYEKSDDEIRLAGTRKAKSFTKKSRPNYIKKRFRHSVIGNGNEFSDLDEALLLDPTLLEDEAGNSQGQSSAKSVEYAFTKYLSQLYANDVADSKNNFASRVRGNNKNKEVPVGILVDIEETSNSSQRKATKNKENRRTFTDGINMNTKNSEKFEEYILPDKIPDHFGQGARFHSAEISGFSPVNAESPASVAFSREQKRRLKRKMKQALRKPENYFYMGNL